MKKPALLLLPNLLGDHAHHQPFLPASVDKAVATIDGLICESAMSGRRYLGRFETDKPAHEIPISLFNKNTGDDDIDFFLEPIINEQQRWGLISDAGLPCIADPGYQLVRRARERGITIQAFVGPSALTLALMLSGLPAQPFTFHGYLPKVEQNRCDEITLQEEMSRRDGTTQVFIETPFRNRHTLESLIATMKPSTQLCIAWDLTLPTQGVLTQSIELWKKSPLPNLEKRCCTFLFNASARTPKSVSQARVK